MNKITRNRWYTRRWMIQVSFWELILTLPSAAILYKFGWIDVAFITAISGLATGIALAIAGMVSTYIGSAAYDDVNYPKKDGES